MGFYSTVCRGESFVVVSSDQADADPIVNLRNRINLFHQLQQLVVGGMVSAIYDCVGHYKGEEEVSFVCVLPELVANTAVTWVQDIAKQYNQESILSVNSGMKARLLYADGSVQFLGDFRSFNPVAEATPPESYSVVEGRYYHAY